MHIIIYNSDVKSNSISTIEGSSGPSFRSLTTLKMSKNQINDEAFKNLSELFQFMPNLVTLWVVYILLNITVAFPEIFLNVHDASDVAFPEWI